MMVKRTKPRGGWLTEPQSECLEKKKLQNIFSTDARRTASAWEGFFAQSVDQEAMNDLVVRMPPHLQ